MKNVISLKMFRQQNDYGYFKIVQIKKKIIYRYLIH